MARILSGLAGFAVALSMSIPSAAVAQASDAKTAAIGASAQFAIGYGVWRIEQKCMKMPAAKHDEYGRLIADSMRRLREAVDERLFNAAVGSGEDTANDPKLAKCDDAGLFDFGMQQAKEALGKLVSLPSGYHLTISN
ncbi:MAG: hypothetical protein ABIR51_07545 [Sphingomicrobium sp.]